MTSEANGRRRYWIMDNPRPQCTSSRARGERVHSCHGEADALDLAKVQQVVPGVQPPQLFQAFFAALDMQADTCEVGRGGALQQSQVGTTQHPEYLERLGWIGVFVMQSIGPEVLIVAGNLRAILRED